MTRKAANLPARTRARRTYTVSKVRHYCERGCTRWRSRFERQPSPGRKRPGTRRQRPPRRRGAPFLRSSPNSGPPLPGQGCRRENSTRSARARSEVQNCLLVTWEPLFFQKPGWEAMLAAANGKANPNPELMLLKDEQRCARMFRHYAPLCTSNPTSRRTPWPLPSSRRKSVCRSEESVFWAVKFLERGRGRISFETQFSRLEQRLRRTVGSGSPPIPQ